MAMNKGQVADLAEEVVNKIFHARTGNNGAIITCSKEDLVMYMVNFATHCIRKEIMSRDEEEPKELGHAEGEEDGGSREQFVNDVQEGLHHLSQQERNKQNGAKQKRRRAPANA